MSALAAGIDMELLFLFTQVDVGFALLLKLDLGMLKKYLFLLIVNLFWGAVMWSCCWSWSARLIRVNWSFVMHLTHFLLMLKVQSLLR